MLYKYIYTNECLQSEGREDLVYLSFPRSSFWLLLLYISNHQQFLYIFSLKLSKRSTCSSRSRSPLSHPNHRRSNRKKKSGILSKPPYTYYNIILFWHVIKLFNILPTYDNLKRIYMLRRTFSINNSQWE
jgi:hypothetical protein